MRIKDKDLLEVVEDVFDMPTVEAIIKLMNRGIIDKIYGGVAQGKEAKVFWAVSPKGEDLAIKIFYVSTAQFIKGRYKYIEGDPRFQRIRRDTRKLIEQWCSKEYRNLVKAYEAGVRVPKPIACLSNVLVMEFISCKDQRGVPAPLIKENPPDDPEEAYWTIIEYVRRACVKAELVHADLSEYNIMNTGDELVIIDWGSAVRMDHPMAKEFLRRDIENITRFFKKLGLRDVSVDEIYNKIVEEYESQ